MKEIKIQLENFDIFAFMVRTIEFLDGQVSPEVDPSYSKISVGRPTGVPVFGPGGEGDVFWAFVEEREKVFFPLACAGADGTITCADGNIYKPAADNEDFKDEMLIGMVASFGFLVQVKHCTVIINSAIHAGGACPGPGPSVDICSDCGLLEEPMKTFIHSFIKE